MNKNRILLPAGEYTSLSNRPIESVQSRKYLRAGAGTCTVGIVPIIPWYDSWYDSAAGGEMANPSKLRASKTKSTQASGTVSNGCVKFAISFPLDDFSKLEQIRRELNITRSQFFLQAARRWFDQVQREEAISEYVRGYENIPEEKALLKAMESAQAQSLAEENW